MQSYSDYEEDKNYKKLLKQDSHFLYSDYYLVEISNFYKDSFTDETQIISSIESIEIIDEASIWKAKFSKDKFENKLNDNEFNYILIKDLVDDDI